MIIIIEWLYKRFSRWKKDTISRESPYLQCVVKYIPCETRERLQRTRSNRESREYHRLRIACYNYRNVPKIEKNVAEEIFKENSATGWTMKKFKSTYVIKHEA